MLWIIGAAVVAVCVAGGFVLGGGNLLALWHPTELVIIGGAGLGAFIASNPKKVLKGVAHGILDLFKGARYQRGDYVDLLKLIYEILQKIRKDGLISIEVHVEAPYDSSIFNKYPKVLEDARMVAFITDCLRLMVGGNLNPHELESLLEYELETYHHEAAEPAHALQKAADALPGFGIVAAVLGIVNTMRLVGSAPPAEIGQSVAIALVGTFLGILLAYGFVGPMAAALEHRAHEEGKAFEVVKMALVASVRGYSPKVAVEFARKLLFSGVRPTFADLEAEMKATRV